MSAILSWLHVYFKLIILKKDLTLSPSSFSRQALFIRANVWDLPQKWRSGRLEAIWAPCCNKHAINPELVQPICHTQQSDEALVWSWAYKLLFQDTSVHPRYIRLTPGLSISDHKSLLRHAVTRWRWMIQGWLSGHLKWF